MEVDWTDDVPGKVFYYNSAILPIYSLKWSKYDGWCNGKIWLMMVIIDVYYIYQSEAGGSKQSDGWVMVHMCLSLPTDRISCVFFRAFFVNLSRETTHVRHHRNACSLQLASRSVCTLIRWYLEKVIPMTYYLGKVIPITYYIEKVITMNVLPWKSNT